jgi:hypothetical protein
MVLIWPTILRNYNPVFGNTYIVPKKVVMTSLALLNLYLTNLQAQLPTDDKGDDTEQSRAFD